MKESVEQLHLITLNVGLARHYADWNWKEVNSPFARIFYVVEGDAELVLPDGVYPLRPGHMYFVPPSTTHSYRCDAHFVHYYLHIYEDAPDSSGFLEEWAFPVEVGCTPQQYINRKKVEQAQLILLTEKLPVKSVAYMLGFEDHSYFNRLPLNALRSPKC